MHSNSLISKFQNVKLTRGYYNASILYLKNFKYGKDKCPNCNYEKSCFIIPTYGEFEILCTDCLKTAQIKFSHDTEKGIVSTNKLLPSSPKEYDISRHVKEEYINKLLDTPEFSTIQGGQWKIHCDDFMEFQGQWRPQDFTKNSKSTGKNLFLEMTNEDSNHIWDELDFKDDEIEFTWSDVEYYAFKCLKCSAFKGFWEY